MSSHVKFLLSTLVAILIRPVLVSGKWNTTKFLFTFGDSYTTDGFNISAGVNSAVPGFVSLPAHPSLKNFDLGRCC